MIYTSPGGNPSSVASITGSSSDINIFGYEANDTMANNAIAKARRVGFFLAPGATTKLTSDGWALFDAAVCWAMSFECSFSGGPGNKVPLPKLSGSPLVGAPALTVSFDATGSTDPDGTIASYDWDFGDGTTGSGISPSHTYANSGTYEVELTITDNDTSMATAGISLTVTNPGGVVAGLNAMDNLLYHYYPNTNRLEYVDDFVDPDAYEVDIDDQAPNNYVYDEIGQLVTDSLEGIDSIKWNVQNKIRFIQRKPGSSDPELEFRYDALGNRIVKIVKEDNLWPEWTYTYYVRDAQGNILTTYTRSLELVDSIPNPNWTHIDSANWPPDSVVGSDHLSLFHTNEYHLYGSKRLGLHQYRDTLKALVLRYDGWIIEEEVPDTVHLISPTAIPYEPTAWFADSNGVRLHLLARGQKRYEFANHLGNVLAVISDRKLQVDSSGVVGAYLPDQINAQDYYPFGMLMPGRGVSLDEYRFSFQGQEADDEIKGEGNSVFFKYRVHDPRIGRFLSIDPLAPDYPWNSPYAFSENRVVDGVELEGLEYIRADQINQFRNQYNPFRGALTPTEINDQSRYMDFKGTEYFWVGGELYNGPAKVTFWLNDAFSNQNLNNWKGTFESYNVSQRSALGECHDHGCCIDCFNLAVKNTYGIKESELTDSRTPLFPHRIDYTMKKLIKKGLAESPVIINPVAEKTSNGTYRASHYDQSIGDVLINATDGVRGTYVFAISPGEGYHSTSVILDYTDPANPLFYYRDQHANVNDSYYEASVHGAALTSQQLDNYFIGWTNGAIDYYDKEGKINASSKKHIEGLSTSIYKLKEK
jgi:RHS repeat-associated protein